jgi:hypothetical protein
MASLKPRTLLFQALGRRYAHTRYYKGNVMAAWDNCQNFPPYVKSLGNMGEGDRHHFESGFNAVQAEYDRIDKMRSENDLQVIKLMSQLDK